MNENKNCLPARLFRIGLCAFFSLVFFSPALHAQGADGDKAALEAAISRLTSNTVRIATVSLTDLGFSKPIVLSGRETRRDLFFPIPRGSFVRDGGIDLVGRYLRGNGEYLSYVASVDGVPLSATPLDGDEGGVSVHLAVREASRPSGFVNLNVAWSAVPPSRGCAALSEMDNGAFEISPATSLTYSYDRSAVTNIAGAWDTLPQDPILVVAHGRLSEESYDTAWRLLAVLDRAGKHPAVRAFPQVGDTVDLPDLEVPAPLAKLPAFRRFTAPGPHRIESEAEIGLLILLAHQGGLNAHFVVDDEPLRRQLGGAVTAFLGEIAKISPAAADRVEEWWNPPSAGNPDPEGSIHFQHVGNSPVIALKGAAAPGMLTSIWRPTAVVSNIRVTAANVPGSEDRSAIGVGRLGGQPGTFDVLERGDWTANFDLASLHSRGRQPKRFQIDVSAAPGAAYSAPVASVLLNDFLLGARRLDADGRPERISVDIPHYALRLHNTLRVSFQRQLMSDGCREKPSAFPVSVLPSSHVEMGAASSAADFLSVMLRLSDRPTLMVPESYLSDLASLSHVALLAQSFGLSPVSAKLDVVSAASSPAPATPFLALDVAVDGANLRAHWDDDHLRIDGADDEQLLDVTELDHLSLAQAVKVKGQFGVVFSTIGATAPALTEPFFVKNGDVALISSEGPIATIGTSGRDEEMEAEANPLWGWGYKQLAIVGGGLAAFLLLLLVAQRARNRRMKGGK